LARLQAEALWVGNTLRTENEKLLQRAQPTAPAEQRHRARKHVWNTKLRLRVRSLVDSARSMLQQHLAEEAALLADWVDTKAPLSNRLVAAMRRFEDQTAARADNAEAIAALTAELKLLKKQSDTADAALKGSKARAAAAAAIAVLGGDSADPETAWGESPQAEAVAGESRAHAADTEERAKAGGSGATADDSDDEEPAASQLAGIPSGALPKDAAAVERTEREFMGQMEKVERTRSLLAKQLKTASELNDKLEDATKLAQERTPAPLGAAAAGMCAQCRSRRAHIMCGRSACSGPCCVKQGEKPGAPACSHAH
jgi:hypothetical protein